MVDRQQRDTVGRTDAAAIERRVHPRFTEEAQVRFRDLEGPAPSRWGITRDLSLGGLALHSEHPLAVGAHLAVEIHIAGEPAPVLALGHVLRCGQGSAGHVAGVQFLWVGEEDRGNLTRLADYFRREYGDPGPDPLS